MTVAAGRLAALLGEGVAGAFCASRTASADSLSIEVRGVGPLQLPVPRAQARHLAGLGRPARYGRGTQTLVDRAIRDTWEIPKSRVRIDKRSWDLTAGPLLERLRRDLGLPDGARLVAQLHSALVYAPGQFFLRHQDSEKDDDMVGSLVVTLPGAYSGGVLEVEHRGRTVKYRGSRTRVSFVAFYADCRHHITPVRSGHRVVLTFNLLLRGVPVEMDADPSRVDELAGQIGEHLSDAVDPRRLVFLLDHEYTRRGMAWSRLKGDDARRVTALRQAAERAGCECTLALTDVHETWSAYGPDDEGYGWGGRWGARSWDEDDEEDGDYDDYDDAAGNSDVDEDDYQLEELIEAEVVLDSWVDPGSGSSRAIGLAVPGEEVCAATPSGELHPYSSEYEGYMGNWGNTLDRWDHRGAVVVWPRRLSFAVRAEASPAWALGELAALARSGDRDRARQQAASLAPFWDGAAGQVDDRRFFAKALRVAAALEDPATAGMLVEPFGLRQLSVIHAGGALRRQPPSGAPERSSGAG